jgi:hypothetical protein
VVDLLLDDQAEQILVHLHREPQGFAFKCLPSRVKVYPQSSRAGEKQVGSMDDSHYLALFQG